MSVQTASYEDPPCPPTSTSGPRPLPPEPEPPPDDDPTEPVPAAATIMREMRREMDDELAAYRRIYRLPGQAIYIELPPFLDGR
jgi:hypothetical protein